MRTRGRLLLLATLVALAAVLGSRNFMLARFQVTPAGATTGK
jgi:hypothetical protein